MFLNQTQTAFVGTLISTFWATELQPTQQPGSNQSNAIFPLTYLHGALLEEPSYQLTTSLHQTSMQREVKAAMKTKESKGCIWQLALRAAAYFSSHVKDKEAKYLTVTLSGARSRPTVCYSAH